MGDAATGHPAAGPPRRSAASRLGAGWGTALAGAVGAALVLGAFAEGIVFAVWAAGRGTGSPIEVARTGGLLFALFHRVSLVFGSASARPGGSVGGSFAFALAPLLGTLLGGGMLYRAGRATAEVAGGGRWERALQGLKPALPYAAISLAAAWGSRVRRLPIGIVRGLPSAPSAVSIHPSYSGAALWALGLAAVFGVCAGVLSVGRSLLSVRSPRALGLGAVAGGWSMLWMALGFSFAGLLVLGAIHPHLTATYFNGAFDRGAARGAVLVGLNLLVAPNMAVLVLAASVGSCVGVFVPGTAASGCFLSWTRFPTGGTLTRVLGIGVRSVPPAGLSRPPIAYFLFLLAPALAGLIGGAFAARRAEARSRLEGAAAGAGAGVVFGALALLAALAATIAVRISGAIVVAGVPVRTGRALLRIGPQVVATGALAAVWGVLGGTIGGLLRRPPPPSVTVPAWAGPPEDSERPTARTPPGPT